MDNKSGDQLLIMQDTIDANKRHYDEKVKNFTEDLTTMFASMMDQVQNSKSLPYKKDSPNYQDPTTVVPSNKKAPPL